MQLHEQIESIAARRDVNFTAAHRAVFDEFKGVLNRGVVRAAERNKSGEWVVQSWVKQCFAQKAKIRML